jgi:hypothetical protein
MSDSRAHGKPTARQAKTIQVRSVRAELRAGRRWKWWGKQGWWLHCSLLHEQKGMWRVRHFVATFAEACVLLNVHEDDWTWQPVSPEEADAREPQQQGYAPFLMF